MNEFITLLLFPLSYLGWNMNEAFKMLLVPHSESGVAPMSSLSGVGLMGFWEFGMGGLIG